MPTYTYYPTKYFIPRLKKIKRRDPHGHRRIHEVIERLLETPDAADGKMTGTHHGRFKKYVGRRDYRIIYYYCELCRKQNKRLEESGIGKHQANEAAGKGQAQGSGPAPEPFVYSPK